MPPFRLGKEDRRAVFATLSLRRVQENPTLPPFLPDCRGGGSHSETEGVEGIKLGCLTLQRIAIVILSPAKNPGKEFESLEFFTVFRMTEDESSQFF
jgi:hypothetical protein